MRLTICTGSRSLACGLVVLLFVAGFQIMISIADVGYHSEAGPQICASAVRANDTVVFVNATAQAKLTSAGANYYQWGDYNNDGYMDLLAGGYKLFRNNGPPGFNFTDVTSVSNLSGWSTTGVWGDYNNDGYLDLYACRGLGARDILWKNLGPPNYKFQDVTKTAGNVSDTRPTTAASWGDYDRDGWLDLYVVNGEDWNDGNPKYFPDALWHNNGDGTFSNVTVSAGIDTTSSPIYGRGVQWADFNNDGWPDAYVSNYRLGANYLWVNNHDGTFTDRAKELGCAGIGRDSNGNLGGNYYGHTIGASFGDYDNDGDFDLFMANLAHRDPSRGKFCDASEFYRNNGGPGYNFTDVRAQLGIPTFQVGGLGYDPYDGQTYYKDELFSNIAFGDYDNDGWLDFYMPQVYDFPWTYSFLYHNNGDGTFTNLSESKDIRAHNGYAGAWADYDSDGDLDLITYGGYPAHTGSKVRLYENQGPIGHWLYINLFGNGFTSNSQAIGARVKLTYSTVTQVREVTAGSGSHSAQDSITLEFGLGAYAGSVNAEIRWPDGLVQNETITTTDRVLNFTEPDCLITGITADKLTALEDEVLNLSATYSGSPTQFHWDLDGDFVTDYVTAVPQITTSYPRSGDYRVRLKALSATITEAGYFSGSAYVHVVNALPLPNITTPTLIYEDQYFELNASATWDTPSDRANLSYRIGITQGGLELRDSNWTLSPAFSTNLSLYGHYTANLAVMDGDGQVATCNATFTVSNMLPSCNITSNLTVIEDAVTTLEVIGSDTTSDLGMLQYRWEFGDGTGTVWLLSNNTEHSFAESKVFDVVVWVQDKHGALSNDTIHLNVTDVAPACSAMKDMTADEDEDVSFSGSGSDTASDTTTLKYFWDFGDGNASTLKSNPQATHAYTRAGTYTAVLTVLDHCGLNAIDIVNVTVKNVAPSVIPDPEMDGTEHLEDEQMQFSCMAIDTASDMANLRFMWDFGDGQGTNWSLSGDAPHSYSTEGTFYPVVHVIDDDGAEANGTFALLVSNVAPTGELRMSQSSVNEDSAVTLLVSSTYDTASDIGCLNYTWKIGNTWIGYEEEMNYTPTQAASLQVILEISDDEGAKVTVKKTLAVVNVAPVAEFSASATTIDAGATVTFDASKSLDTPSDMPSLNYTWKIGKSDTLYGKNISYTFQKGGNYTINLIVTDNDRASSEAEAKVSVKFTTVPSDDDDDDTDAGGNEVMYLVIGIVVILVLAGAILLFFVMRKKKATGKGAAPEVAPAKKKADAATSATKPAKVKAGAIPLKTKSTKGNAKVASLKKKPSPKAKKGATKKTPSAPKTSAGDEGKVPGPAEGTAKGETDAIGEEKAPKEGKGIEGTNQSDAGAGTEDNPTVQPSLKPAENPPPSAEAALEADAGSGPDTEPPEGTPPQTIDTAVADDSEKAAPQNGATKP